MMDATLQMACTAPKPTTLVALQWRMTRTYSWIHAADGDPTSYAAPRRTLCGKRPYDPSLVASGDAALGAITCDTCTKILAARHDAERRG